MSVDFPAPFGPMTPTNLPQSTVKSACASTGLPSYPTVMSRSRTAGAISTRPSALCATPVTVAAKPLASLIDTWYPFESASVTRHTAPRQGQTDFFSTNQNHAVILICREEIKTKSPFQIIHSRITK
jgi:hypothetical protein